MMPNMQQMIPPSMLGAMPGGPGGIGGWMPGGGYMPGGTMAGLGGLMQSMPLPSQPTSQPATRWSPPDSGAPKGGNRKGGGGGGGGGGKGKGGGGKGKGGGGGGKGKGHNDGPKGGNQKGGGGKKGGQSKGGNHENSAPKGGHKGGEGGKSGGGKGKGGKGWGGKGKWMYVPYRSELTPEEIQQRKEAAAARHTERTQTEERKVLTSERIEGEVLQRARRHAWVKPKDASQIPEECKAKLKEMNDEFRAKVTDGRAFCGGVEGEVLYLTVADITEEKLLLTPGLPIKFKVYMDTKGVGACDVVSAAPAALPSPPLAA